jgi:cysteinyl-tRNA synthetase
MKNSEAKKTSKKIENAKEQFLEIMGDDLNTSKALSFLWEILRDEKLNDAEKYEIVLEFDKVLGLRLGEEEIIEIPEIVKKLVEEREKERHEKNWKKADELRAKIKKLGYVIDDTDNGTKVKRE